MSRGCTSIGPPNVSVVKFPVGIPTRIEERQHLAPPSVIARRLVACLARIATGIALTTGSAYAQDHAMPCERLAGADTVFSDIAGRPVRRMVRVSQQLPPWTS